MNPPTICTICHATILPATSAQTGGLCMPCTKGTRYRHVAYLSIDEFFAKCAGEDCLAPNLDPHPGNAELKTALMRLSEDPRVIRCVIPVIEYQEPERQLEPYSDRVFIAGTIDEETIAMWTRELGAGFYREDRPGVEMPREFSNDGPGCFVVWD